MRYREGCKGHFKGFCIMPGGPVEEESMLKNIHTTYSTLHGSQERLGINPIGNMIRLLSAYSIYHLYY